MPDSVTVNAHLADKDMPAWAIRLEGKVDLVVAQQAQRLDAHGEDLKDHENRIRYLESVQPEDGKHRLRVVEERKTVAPAQLYTAICLGVATVGGLATAINVFVK